MKAFSSSRQSGEVVALSFLYFLSSMSIFLFVWLTMSDNMLSSKKRLRKSVFVCAPRVVAVGPSVYGRGGCAGNVLLSGTFDHAVLSDARHSDTEMLTVKSDGLGRLGRGAAG